jgi:hypothetical protein
VFRRAAAAERWGQARCLARWWVIEYAPWLGGPTGNPCAGTATSRPAAQWVSGLAGSRPVHAGAVAAPRPAMVWPPFLLPLPLPAPAPRPSHVPVRRPVAPVWPAQHPRSAQTIPAAAFGAHLAGLAACFKKVLLWTGVAGAGLAASGAAAVYANYVYWHRQQPAEFFLQRLAAKVRPGVFGPTGDWLGVIPPAKDAIFQLNRVGVEMTRLPKDFQRLLLRLEDGHAGQWYRGHVAGVDWAAVPVRFGAGLLPGRKAGGASTLWMQTVSMAGGFKAQYPRVQRKLREYAGAAELYDAMGGDVSRVALAYASIAPYARGMGGDVIGLVAAADVLFGMAPDKLTLAQSAILASAPNQPLWIGEDSLRARSTFAAVKRRAILALESEFEVISSQPAIAEIKAMGDLPPVRARLGNVALAATGSVEGRTRAFVLPVLPAIRADLIAIQDEEASRVVASR